MKTLHLPFSGVTKQVKTSRSQEDRAVDRPSIDHAHSQLFTETAAYSIKMRPYLSSLFRN